MNMTTAAKWAYEGVFTAIMVVSITAVSPSWAQETSTISAESHKKVEDPESSGGEESLAPRELDLAEIIPSASQLSGRLATLESNIKGLLSVSDVQTRCARIEADLTGPTDQLQKAKQSREYGLSKLLDIKEDINQQDRVSQEISEPLSQSIGRLEDWRKEWLAEREQWKTWQSSLLEERMLEQLQSTLDKATVTIDTALDLILSELDAILTLQERVAETQARIISSAAELDGLIESKQRNALLTRSPPMLSAQYYSQFESGDLWYALQTCLFEISWPDSRFFARQGWIILTQIFASLFLSVVVYRNRGSLSESQCWRFLAARPVSAGLFYVSMMAMLVYEYEGAPTIWRLANMSVAGISFCRLAGALIEVSWKRWILYGVLAVFLVTKLLSVLDFPVPLVRLYIVLTALFGLVLCLRLNRQGANRQASRLYAWLLHLAPLFLAVILFGELGGKDALSSYLFTSLIESIATVLVFMLFLYTIHGGFEYVFGISPVQRTVKWSSGETNAIVRRVAGLIDFCTWGLVVIPSLLVIWGVYGDLAGATKGLLALGFNIGAQRITIGLAIVSAGVLYGSFLVSDILQKLLMNQVLLRRQIALGVRHAIARLVHYVIIVVGFLLALTTLGIEVTKLTIMLSALGVGVGFGLQGIVNNFVNGLVLLFERPVRIGDTIELSGKFAEIKRIGLRATTVRTVDGADLTIPNADLINNEVINWTLGNCRARLTIPVGVAYGSDVPLVMERLMTCASGNLSVAEAPTPEVLFRSFGESSLDFELRLWVVDVRDRLTVASELHQEIDRSFQEAKIEIAFPQRDLRLRGMGKVLDPLD
ncbi:mechanosensitive ion channel domain-containing protein [Candidatus Sumerlaeota bacterium]